MTDLVIGAGAFLAFLWLLAPPPPRGRRVVHTRRGLEMMARNGRLVHVRETESEHEL